jgi:CRP-like cAMP-binding protein
VTTAEVRPLLLRLQSIGQVSDAARVALGGLPLRVRQLEKGEDAARDGDRSSECCLLLGGFMHRYKILPDGDRQILSFHVTGDVPDLQSLYLHTMDHSLAATVKSTVAFVRHDHLQELFHEHRVLLDLMWRETLIDAAAFRMWLVVLGRQPAPRRLAHLCCELFVRLRAVGLADANSCSVPLTQQHLADALGLSLVHTNRTLQQLRAENLLEFGSSQLIILDWAKLKETAQFDPGYLHFRDKSVGR